ncbi:MAG: hypothetical protein L0154_23025 [Chloroflexi bacterium]|nr:hypothetical protein [Chloroflexota bacterium]
MNRLEGDYEDRVKFVYLNANEDGKQAFQAGNFRGHPAFVLMRPDGEELWRQFGIVDYSLLETAIVEALEQ